MLRGQKASDKPFGDGGALEKWRLEGPDRIASIDFVCLSLKVERGGVKSRQLNNSSSRGSIGQIYKRSMVGLPVLPKEERGTSTCAKQAQQERARIEKAHKEEGFFFRSFQIFRALSF